MAMRQLGKLQFETKDGALHFKWGDGEEHRLGLKKQPESLAPEEDYTQNYAYPDEEDRDYGEYDYADDGRGRADYADEGYSDSDYSDEGYSDGDYADDGYSGGDYTDDGYDDGEDRGEYADDDYSDVGYGGDQYDDDSYEDGQYDDDGYGDEQYDDERYDDEQYDDGQYGEDYRENEPYGDYTDEYNDDYGDGRGGIMDTFFRYVDQNEWLIYVLLVLLPPLGIYLMWRRGCFDTMIRYAVSAASGVWFVALLVMLSMLIFGGFNDVEKPNQLPVLQPTPVTQVQASPSVMPSPSPSAVPNSGLIVQPSATPIGGVQPNDVPGSLVWTSGTNSFYHNNEHCSMIADNENTTQVTLENAKNRGKYACPVCYGGETYYATPGGKYYHLDKDCSDMSNAEVYSKEKAEAEHKKPCPVCVTKTQTSLLPVVEGSANFLTPTTKDRSGIKVWCTPGGKNYHMTKNCSGMQGAEQVPLRDAILMGKTACKTCCDAGNTMVYCTKNGTYYHRNEDCSGMKNASRVTLAEALVLGKKECPTCKPVANADRPSQVPQNSRPESTRPESTRPPAFNDEHAENRPQDEHEHGYYVYATPGGTYYHLKKHCSGMTGAQRVPLSQMIKEGRPACPVCASGANKTVYATPGGKYYHSYPTCSGMDHAMAGSLEDALAYGFKRCPKCWGSNNSGTEQQIRPPQDVQRPDSHDQPSAADSIMVYATRNGKWYHTNKHCSGMKDASKITLATAVKAGKSACPVCASGANKMVYSTNGGKYYHRDPHCSGMENAKRRTLADALLLGQTACPVCVSNEHLDESGKPAPNKPTPGKPVPDKPETGGKPSTGGDRPDGSHDFEAGASGIKVYASENGRYYHLDKHCSGDPNQSHITLETALNYGKEPCPKCASTAHTKVYGTPNGKYYHKSKSCAGSGAVSADLQDALAWGYKPCPYCVDGKGSKPEKPAHTDKFKPGTSGVDVYASISGPYYHRTKSCAGSGAQKISLETALNYGKKACPVCCEFADRTVYSVKGSKYYHSKKYCEPGKPISGTLAEALAFGLKECPYCIGGGGSGPLPEHPTPTQGPEYSAPESSSVYIDLYSDMFYYHKNSSCPQTGMKKGTEVTLEYAKDFGYKRCPYCNPPSKID